MRSRRQASLQLGFLRGLIQRQSFAKWSGSTRSNSSHFRKGLKLGLRPSDAFLWPDTDRFFTALFTVSWQWYDQTSTAMRVKRMQWPTIQTSIFERQPSTPSPEAGRYRSLGRGPMFGDGYSVPDATVRVAVELFIRRQEVQKITRRTFAVRLTAAHISGKRPVWRRRRK